MRDSRPRGLAGMLAMAALAALATAPPAQVSKRTSYGQLRYDRSERKRAQWKNETNKRGRNR